MRRLALLLAVTLTLPSFACRGRVKPPDDLSGAMSDGSSSLPAPTLPALGSQGLDRAVAAVVANFERVHFALDSSRLDGEARAALSANAELLKRYPTVRVEVEGHADERGTVDYNLALGQRRAAAVVDHLRDAGVSVHQLRTVSLGEEMPLQRGSGEVAWSANRRAEFVVLTPGQPVRGTTVSRRP
jgi:peptidoglycan-associated lipoprotein